MKAIKNVFRILLPLIATIILLLYLGNKYLSHNLFEFTNPLTSITDTISQKINSLTKKEEKIELEGPYEVIKVVDGDTIRINYNGVDTYVRLIGIDTPESVNPDESKNTPEGQAASDYTKLIITTSVYLEFDTETKDKYDRLLAYVYLSDGTMLNEKIIKDGYAYQMTMIPNVKYSNIFSKAFEYARENALGLWKEE